MGCLFILNDSEYNIYWKKNFFKIENIIFCETIILIIFSFIAYIAYPYDSFSLIKQKITINTLLLYTFSFSLASFLIILLIKKIHTNNKMKPNHRLCLMNFYARLGFCFVFLCFIFSLYVSLFMIEWEGVTGIIAYRALKSVEGSKKIVISIGKAIFTLIWNELMLLVSIFGFSDFAMEITIIARASKYLSINNNINNQKLLNELFRIPLPDIPDNNTNNTNTLYNYSSDIEMKKDKITKLRLVMSNNDISNEENGIENNDNKFREVEIIQKIEYRSIGIQTDDDNDTSFYNNYINDNIDNNDKLVNDDLSNNFILIKNKSLIDSKTTMNEIMSMPIK